MPGLSRRRALLGAAAIAAVPEAVATPVVATPFTPTGSVPAGRVNRIVAGQPIPCIYGLLPPQRPIGFARYSVSLVDGRLVARDNYPDLPAGVVPA